MKPRILYCHCAYARIVPVATKVEVLKGLASRDVEFDAVPDLCAGASELGNWALRPSNAALGQRDGL